MQHGHFVHVRITVLALALVALLWLLLSASVQAVASALAVRIVVTVSTPLDEYDLSANGACSLREAITTVNGSANFGGCTRVVVAGTGPPTIILPSDTYTLTITGANEDQDATGDLDIRQSVIISTTGATSATVAGMTNWQDRIFHILTSTVTMKSVIIRGGHLTAAGGSGGAVYLTNGASLSLNDSEVANNSASFGGGILNAGTLTLTNVTLYANSIISGSQGAGGALYNYLGTATLANVTLNGNSNSNGGGGFFNFDGLATLTGVTFRSNSSQFGGGYSHFGGTAMLSNVTLDGNMANGSGGGAGIQMLSGEMTLSSVTLSGNSAPNGSSGGIAVNAGNITLTNVTVSANSAAQNGGGIYNNSGIARLTNVTLSGNSSGSGGGGIYNAAGALTLLNTIIANSPSGGNCATFLGASFNLSSDSSCGFGMNRDNRNVMLGPLANNGGSTKTHMLLPLSPAIDFGANAGCPSTDQRGKPRPVGAACDVGAVERQPNDTPVRLNLPLIVR